MEAKCGTGPSETQNAHTQMPAEEQEEDGASRGDGWVVVRIITCDQVYGRLGQEGMKWMWWDV